MNVTIIGSANHVRAIIQRTLEERGIRAIIHVASNLINPATGRAAGLTNTGSGR